MLQQLHTQSLKLLRHWAVVIPLLLVLTGLAMPRLGDAVWYDENRTLWYSGVPAYGDVTTAEAVERIAENRWQAPAYFLMIRAWASVTGWDEVMLRLPSLLLGLIAVAGVYHMVKRHFSAEVAFYAVFTMSVSAFYVNYLHEMRTYTLLLVLVVVLIWSYAWITFGRKHTAVGYVLFTLSTAGLVYAHYFAVFPIAGLGLYHLIGRFRKPRYWQTLACFVIAGLLFLPWMQVLLGGLGLATEDRRIVKNMSLLEALSNVSYMFANGNRAIVILLAVLALPIRDARARFVWYWLAGCIGIAYVATRLYPMLTETRYLLFLWVPISTLVALGISRLEKVGVSPYVVLVLWALLAGRSLMSDEERDLIHPWYTPPLEVVARELEPRVGENDAVMFLLPPNIPETIDQTILDYYLRPAGVTFSRFIPDLYATTDARYAERIYNVINRDDPYRVWVSYETPERNWRVGPVQEEILPGEGYAFCGIVEENSEIYLSLFARKVDDIQQANFISPGGEKIRVYMMHPPNIRDDGTIEVNFGWRLPDDVPGDLYSVGVHVTNEQGELVAQYDRGITNTAFDCDYQRIALAGQPAGTYLVTFVVYNWQTGERLSTELPIETPTRPIMGQVELSG